jgi:hypothetical protein
MRCAELRRMAAVAAAALLTAGSADATLITYSNRADFLAALPGAGQFESFEDESVDVQNGSRTITTSTSQISFVAGDPSAPFGVSDVDVPGHRGPTDGTQYLEVDFLNSSNVIFHFAQPLQAFGIDVVDKNTNDLDGVIGDNTINGAITPGAPDNVQFWGVIATPDSAFTKVGFAGDGGSVPGELFALDNVVFSAVPEPSVLLLSIAAVFGCSFTSFRRHRSN